MAFTLRDLLIYVNSELRQPNEALWLLEELVNMDRTDLYLRLDEIVEDQVLQSCIKSVNEIKAGMPIQYAVGHWQFRLMRLKVDNRCLIPRIETEKLVDLATDHIGQLDKSEIRILDLGTGSLCIPLSIAFEYGGNSSLRIYAVEFSDKALEIAKENLLVYPTLRDSIQLIKSSWFESLDTNLMSSFDLIVANPPYLDKNIPLDRSVSGFEPHMALFSEDNGFYDTKKIINQAQQWMTTGACLIIETDPSICQRAFDESIKNNYNEVELIRDQFGALRFLKAAV